MPKISTSAKYLDWFRKVAGKIHSTWFWDNAVNVKLSERSNPVKIFHIIDIDNLDDFISNTLF